MRYELSIEADEDLELIFDYINNEYGSKQSFKYVSSFEGLFAKVCSNPFTRSERDE